MSSNWTYYCRIYLAYPNFVQQTLLKLQQQWSFGPQVFKEAITVEFITCVGRENYTCNSLVFLKVIQVLVTFLRTLVIYFWLECLIQKYSCMFSTVRLFLWKSLLSQSYHSVQCFYGEKPFYKQSVTIYNLFLLVYALMHICTSFSPLI